MRRKLSPLSKTRLSEIIETFLSNEERLFNLGVATREVKNSLSNEEQRLRALRQDYKEFTEGKDGNIMSALQEKFELLNCKKEKSGCFVTKKEVGMTKQNQYFRNFAMDFKQSRIH